ncbi:hypothetical protein JMJ35_004869 [Cladonia borealis]|uniref:Uncharacterized protein n=1 Tax=Cladonia borealis TaxID=184061 RepID=A0AA39R0V8_9LECA|nr:hypothetical protein JMJ35_004869 [Cladonia borealis]
MYISSLVSSLAPLEQFPPVWWHLLMQNPEFLSWPPESWFALRSLDPGTRDWDKALNGQADLPPQAKEITCGDQRWILWNDEYEEYLKTKLDPIVPKISTICCLRLTITMKVRVEYLEDRSYELERIYNQLSRFLTISISILYTIARLTILVLLFTSLRVVPEEIYKNTPWPRFLLNIF